MKHLTQWVKNNRDLILVGACLVGTAGLVGGALVILKSEDTSTPDSIREVFKNFSGRKDHNFVGLIGLGSDGDLWAHPINAHSFKIGHTDGQIMHYSEYPHEGMNPGHLEIVENNS